MVAEQIIPEITPEGSDGQKELAARAFDAMRAHGMFASEYAPIRVTLASLAGFLDVPEDDVRAAVHANEQIFETETADDTTYVVTSRRGTPPLTIRQDTTHSFAARFMTPEPAPERPLRTEKPVPDVVINAEVADELADTVQEMHEVGDDLESRDHVEVTPPREQGEITVELVSEDEIDVTPTTDEETLADQAVEAVDEVETEPAPAGPGPEPEPASTLTGISDFDDEAVADAIRAALRGDARVANFGDRWMAENDVHRLSRGNLRGLADYINEQEQPLTDDVLVQDVLGTRRSAASFPVARFSMNYRLSSERNFEFLGTSDQPFWGTTDLAPIGTTRRKAGDIGTDYRFLLDEVPEDSVEPRSASTVEHTLSFYEFAYGLLPLDEQMQALLPGPVMPDQRSTVLTFEIPQFENSIYLVEARYPTHNKGGFVLGLDDFYEEKLVPGAMLSIAATENDGQYKIEYLEGEEQQDRFLELDDRRAPKYVFRPLSYDTAVDDDWLVTEERFPRLGGEKPLSEKRRRRIDDVIAVSFERIGAQDGETWTASFADLLVAVNIERPASAEYLRTAIESMASVTENGSDMLTYDASA